MFFFLSKILDIFLSPYTWALGLLVAAIPWRARAARRWKRRRAVGVLGLLLLLFASSMPVSNAIAFDLEHASAPTYREHVTYDVVILLGGVVDEEVTAASGQPAYNDNIERAIMTHRLLRDGKARHVIVSGGTLDPELADYGEAATLGRQLEDWGVSRERIIIEDRAKNTRENAVFSREIVRARGFERVLIVTSAFHMPRAVECFNAVGLPVDTFPVDYRAARSVAGLGAWLPRAQSLSQTSAMVREKFGRWIYRAQGYGKPHAD